MRLRDIIAAQMAEGGIRKRREGGPAYTHAVIRRGDGPDVVVSVGLEAGCERRAAYPRANPPRSFPEPVEYVVVTNRRPR